MHSMSKEFGLSREIFDLDEIRDRSKSFGKPFIPLGTIFGGIESTTDPDPDFPPVFKPEMTEASSRLIDVYCVIEEEF